MLFWLLAVLFFGVRADDDPDVIVLTAQNFDAHIQADLTLVEFYAPWCGHCKQLAPEYAKAATILKQHDPPIPLAKVDATVESSLAQRYSISGYPTMLIFRNGKETKYEGPRQADGIVAYMKKQSGPAAKPLSTKAEIDKFVKSEPFTVIGFFEQGKTSQLHSSFLLVATKLRDNFVFGKVTDPSLCKEYGITGEALVAFKDFDEGKVVYDGSTKTGDVQAWVELHSLPLVGELTPANQEAYQKRGLPIAKFFSAVDWQNNEKQKKYYVNRLKKAAEEHKGKILFALLNKASFSREVSDFNLHQGDGLVIQDPKTSRNYRMEDKFSADNVLKFVRDFSSNALKPYIKSEPVPAKDDGPVKTAVGSNFDEVVSPTKDVMIEFYAPWCGHCKSLAPKYDELGKKLQDVETVTIAKLDATANDFDRTRFEVSGYPTIYFIPAGGSPMKYDGAREVDAMFKFIKKHATHKIGKKK